MTTEIIPYLSEAFAIPGIILSAGIVIFLLALYSSVKPSKSKSYREMMADMYVVGTVKKLAQEDGIDLVAELKEFYKIVKKYKFKI